MLGFAVAAAYWPGIMSGEFVSRWVVIAVGLPLVCSLDLRVIPEWTRWLLGFLMVLGALSLLVSPFPTAGIQDLLFMAFLCAAFLFGAEQISLDAVMTGLTLGFVPSTILSIVQYFDWLQPVMHASQVSGLFYNSEILGEFAALIFIWNLVRRRWALAAMALVPLLLSHSRIGIIVALIAIGYAAPKLRSHRLALISVTVLVAFGCVFLFGAAKFVTAEHRAVIWITVLANLTLLGNGLGWVTLAFPMEQFAHSDALQALAELGIGATLLVLIPIAALRRDNRASHADRALFIAACVEVLVSFPLHFPASGFVSAVVAGFLVGTGPVVCLVDHQRRNDDGPRRIWWDASGWRAFVGRGRGRAALAIRSLSAQFAALCAPGNCAHPTAAGG